MEEGGGVVLGSKGDRRRKWVRVWSIQERGGVKKGHAETKGSAWRNSVLLTVTWTIKRKKLARQRWGGKTYPIKPVYG